MLDLNKSGVLFTENELCDGLFLRLKGQEEDMLPRCTRSTWIDLRRAACSLTFDKLDRIRRFEVLLSSWRAGWPADIRTQLVGPVTDKVKRYGRRGDTALEMTNLLSLRSLGCIFANCRLRYNGTIDEAIPQSVLAWQNGHCLT